IAVQVAGARLPGVRLTASSSSVLTWARYRTSPSTSTLTLEASPACWASRSTSTAARSRSVVRLATRLPSSNSFRVSRYSLDSASCSTYPARSSARSIRYAEVAGETGHPDPIEVGQLLDQVEQVAGRGPGPALLFLGGLVVAAGWPLGGDFPPGAWCARSRRLLPRYRRHLYRFRPSHFSPQNTFYRLGQDAETDPAADIPRPGRRGTGQAPTSTWRGRRTARSSRSGT